MPRSGLVIGRFGVGKGHMTRLGALIDAGSGSWGRRGDGILFCVVVAVVLVLIVVATNLKLLLYGDMVAVISVAAIGFLCLLCSCCFEIGLKHAEKVGSALVK
jgi:hypothetical protein